jgi:hypothetical protein
VTKLLLTFLSVLFFALPLFAQSVDTAWVRRYNGTGNSNDEAISTAVDSSGNVYVTGISPGNGTFNDYGTIKYYPNGGTAWVRTYNGPANSNDYATNVVVDNSGNVYVAGSSYGGSTDWDYVTIKYYSNGDTAWVRRYSGPYADSAYRIAIDNSGNVYVTGWSGNGTNFDYLTIKYNSSGDTSWVRRYNGTGNSVDIAFDIAVDACGKVCITGYSTGDSAGFATICYYQANGSMAWLKTYRGIAGIGGAGFHLTSDESCNIYVAGVSIIFGFEDFDYTTIKYYSNGDTAWVRGYDGPASLSDFPQDIAVDYSGNVYVTGWSTDFRNGGEKREDFATIKYNSSGNELWVKRYVGSGPSFANAIAVDNSGNAYVTGQRYAGSEMDENYTTIKYYPNGDTAWVRDYNGVGDTVDFTQDIAVDKSGNVYVTGSSWGSGTYSDYATIKYVQFLRGDANKDKKVTIADIVYLVSYLFKFGPAPNPIQSGDANCDGKVTIADIVYLVSYLFKFGPVPCI